MKNPKWPSWFPRPRNDRHLLLVLGNALLLCPYPRAGYQIGEMLTRRFELGDWRFWMFWAFSAWSLVTFFWFQAKCLLLLEEQVLKDNNGT